MSLTKVCTCKDTDNCSHEFWFKLKRKRVAVGPGKMETWTHQFDKQKQCGRILIKLEEYFPTEKLRGRGALSEAKRLYRSFCADVDENGRFWLWWQRRHAPTPAPTAALTITILIERYITEHIRANGKHTGRAFLRTLRNHAIELGPQLLAADITTARVIAHIRALQARRKPSGVRSGFYQLIAVFNWAVQTAELLPAIPYNITKVTKALPSQKSVTVRDRRLLPGEEEKLRGTYVTAQQHVLPCMPPLLTMLVDMVLATGLRRNTLRLLQFEDVSPDLSTLHIPASKMKGRVSTSKRTTPRVREIIRTRRETFLKLGCFQPKTYIFGRDLADRLQRCQHGEKLGDVRPEVYFATRDFQVACRHAGIPIGWDEPNALHFHDLRAEAACRLYDRGATALDVMHFLDHTSLDMTQRYLDRVTKRRETSTAAMLEQFEVERRDLVPVHQGAKMGAKIVRLPAAKASNS